MNKPLFSFEWTQGSINDNIIELAESAYLTFRYNHFNEIEIFSDGAYREIIKVFYENDNNIDIYLKYED